MEREHLIIVAILALVLYMLMKHTGDCNCSGCMKDRTVSLPAHIRYANPGDPDWVPPATLGHIRYSDKYIGAGQHIKNHIRHDSRQGMFNGMFSGAPSHRIRYDCDEPGCK